MINALDSPAAAQTGEFAITGVIQDVRFGLILNFLPADTYVQIFARTET
jgi:hypothetical protein